MRTTSKGLFTLMLFATMVLLPTHALCQVLESLSEDDLSTTDFTAVLKDAWSFLKTETDTYHNIIGKKTEFETTPEFEKRSVEARREYLAKVSNYVKDKKLEQRVFGVLFKASLLSYDADNQFYAVKSPMVVEAPYNIPSVVCDIPSNSYVALGDSIKKGYRTSTIYLRFDPAFKWQVVRDSARVAKANEENIFFKVRFKLDVTPAEMKIEARLTFVPREIMLINRNTKRTYWQQPIR